MLFARRYRLPALCLAALLLVLVIPAALPAAAAPTPQDTPAGPPDPQAGRESYAQNCAPCHGDTGAGDGPSASGLDFPPTALGDAAAISDLSPQDWFDVTKNGRIERMMPPWSRRLTDQQIWDTIGYAWSLHTSRAQVEMGKAVYEQSCATCHGPDGVGASPMLDFTDFAATSPISQAAWAEVTANGRDEMPAFGDKLSEAEQTAVLEYVRSLSMGPMFGAPLAPGSGIITGTITNATTGAPVANASVTLGLFDGASLLEERNTATDVTGFYRFEGLSTDPQAVYIARVEYPQDGLPYSSDLGTFAEGQATLALPISVYETTTDASGVRADRVHYIIEFEPGRALIAELLVFGQSGNQAYIGDGEGVLKFTLPPGATDLTIDEGELGEDQRYVRTADGFVDRLPLAPGENVRQVLYRYALPYDGTALDLERTIPYPATNVNVLVTDQGQQVTSPGLTDLGQRQTEQGSFFNLGGENLPANQPITVRFSDLPAAGSSAASPSGEGGGLSRPLLFALIGAGAAMAALLAAWPLLRRRTAPAGDGSSGIPTAGTREALLDALARLTVAHENGEIGDAEYRDRRMRLKAQLLDIEQAARAGKGT